MALIAQYTAPSADVAGYYVRVDVYLDSQSIEDNTSYGHTNVLAVAGGGKYDLDVESWAVSLSGSSPGSKSGSAAPDFSGGNFWLTTNASWSAVHNADGTKSLSSAFSWNGTGYPGWFENGFSGSTGSFALETIPRTTEPTLSPETIDAASTTTIGLPRASDSFTHTISYDFGGLTNQTDGLSASSDVATSATLTPPMALLNQIPNNASGVAAILVTTYSGATYIGESTVNLTVTAPASVVPTIGSVSSSEATATPDVATIVGAYVSGISKLAITADGAAGAYGSTIDDSKTKIVVAGQTINSAAGTTGVISTSGSIPITATVTDTRGRTTSLTAYATFLAYVPPSIAPSSVELLRTLPDGTPDEEGTHIDISFSASVQSLTSDTERNALQYRVSSRANGTSIYTEIVPATTPGGLTFAGTLNISTYAIDASWDILVEVLDVFATAAIARTVATSTIFMHWKGSLGMGVGKYLEDGMLDVAGSIYQNGSKVLDESTQTPGAPAGSILAWVSPTIPANYAEANGQELDRTENSDLFAICGIRFGAGDGSTTFNTPNLTGKVIVASDVSQLDLDEIGKTGGASTVTLTDAEGPPHSHSASTSTDGNHTHQNRGYWTGGGGTGRAISNSYIGGDPTDNNSLLSAGNHSHAVSVGSSGGGDAHENMPPFIALVYIIKLSGGIGVLDNTVETVLIDRVADVESAIEGMGSPAQPITEVQIDTVTRSAGPYFEWGPTFAEITGFKAGSRVHLDFNVPMRNASSSWGGLYFEPQIRFDLGTWQSLGSSGYDMMNTGAQAIQTYNGAILVDPGISAVFSIQIRYLFKAYDSTVVLNGSHDMNKLSGTATLMSGDNGNQFFTKFIIKEILA